MNNSKIGEAFAQHHRRWNPVRSSTQIEQDRLTREISDREQAASEQLNAMAAHEAFWNGHKPLHLHRFK